MTTDLGTFEGLPVSTISLSISELNKVLGRAVSANPEIRHAGDKLYIVCEVEIGDIEFGPVMDDGAVVAWNRGHAAVAKRAAFIEGSKVEKLLAEQAALNIAAADRAAGRMQLSPEAKQEADHAAGLHRRKRKACPICQGTP